VRIDGRIAVTPEQARERDVRDAIARETQLKRWSRSKKVELIDRLNPSSLDLASMFYKTDNNKRFLDFALWLRSK
jgi:hypothetical protein